MTNDNNSELYGTLVAIEVVEEAYACNNLNSKQYDEVYRKLLAQFQIIHNSLGNPNIVEFTSRNKMNCDAAIKHILSTNQECHSVQKLTMPKAQVEIVQHYITVINVLKLKMNTVDVIFPSLKEIAHIMNINKGFESDIIRKWVDILSTLPDNSELTTEQINQLILDLECSYTDLQKILLTI
jgi:hypothetical protein